MSSQIFSSRALESAACYLRKCSKRLVRLVQRRSDQKRYLEHTRMSSDEHQWILIVKSPFAPVCELSWETAPVARDKKRRIAPTGNKMVIVVRLMERAGAGITGDQWGRALTGTTPWLHVCLFALSPKIAVAFSIFQYLW